MSLVEQRVAPTRASGPYDQSVADAQQYPTDVLWACVEDGFHVGSRGGDFLGFVDRRPNGTFRAHDSHSQPVGDFPSLREATSAVTNLQATDPTRQSADAQGVTP